MTHRVIEYLGLPSDGGVPNGGWKRLAAKQLCPFLGRKCVKVRKSDPTVSIGTCTVAAGEGREELLICPHRFLQGHRAFAACLHLLTNHEPGNDLHLVPEVSIPGGSVDYFIVSSRQGKVEDFVGVELQTLDTTGSVWADRQAFLRSVRALPIGEVRQAGNGFGINWKMTAKTTLVQLHHKVSTFEHIGKKIVMVIQDKLLDYLESNFLLGHFSDKARLGDPLHLHSYRLDTIEPGNRVLSLDRRLSTDSAGVATALGLQAEARVDTALIIGQLERKLPLAMALRVL